jgi:hypothetical protein
MTVHAIFMQAGTSVTAQQQRLRQTFGSKAWQTGSNLTTRMDMRGGVLPQTDAFLVSAQSSPNMSVRVARGSAIIPGMESVTQGNYYVHNDALISSLAVGAAHASLYRTDSVVVRVKDSSYSGVSNLGEVVVVQGTVTAATESAATPPTAVQIGNNHEVLYNIVVRPNTTSILNSDLRDRRHWLTAPGGVALPRTHELSDPGILTGDWRDTGTSLDRWNGTAWKPQLYIESIPEATGTIQRSDGTLNINSAVLSSGWASYSGSGLTFPRSGWYTIDVSFMTDCAGTRYIEFFADIYRGGVTLERYILPVADASPAGFGSAGGTTHIRVPDGDSFFVLFRCYANVAATIRPQTWFRMFYNRPLSV